MPLLVGTSPESSLTHTWKAASRAVAQLLQAGLRAESYTARWMGPTSTIAGQDIQTRNLTQWPYSEAQAWP
jgi:hypothetical protein